MPEDPQTVGEPEASFKGIQDADGVAAQTLGRGVPPETLAAAYRVMGRFAWKGNPPVQQEGEPN